MPSTACPPASRLAPGALPGRRGRTAGRGLPCSFSCHKPLLRRPARALSCSRPDRPNASCHSRLVCQNQPSRRGCRASQWWVQYSAVPKHQGGLEPAGPLRQERVVLDVAALCELGVGLCVKAWRERIPGRFGRRSNHRGSGTTWDREGHNDPCCVMVRTYRWHRTATGPARQPPHTTGRTRATTARRVPGSQGGRRCACLDESRSAGRRRASVPAPSLARAGSEPVAALQSSWDRRSGAEASACWARLMAWLSHRASGHRTGDVDERSMECHRVADRRVPAEQLPGRPGAIRPAVGGQPPEALQRTGDHACASCPPCARWPDALSQATLSTCAGSR